METLETPFYCSECGAKMFPSAWLCSQCGVTIHRPTTETADPNAAQKDRTCPRCRSVARPSVMVCNRCGATATLPVRSAASALPPRDSDGMPWQIGVHIAYWATLVPLGGAVRITRAQTSPLGATISMVLTVIMSALVVLGLWKRYKLAFFFSLLNSVATMAYTLVQFNPIGFLVHFFLGAILLTSVQYFLPESPLSSSHNSLY